jgi:hypothetical protein
MKTLKRLGFNISYLALLTRERVKPLSRWEGRFSRRQVKALRHLGLKTDTVDRPLLNGGTTSELIFSPSSRYLDLYRRKYHRRPITKDRRTVTDEGFLFGYPHCCVVNFAENGYADNEFTGRGQEILFHWACPECRATPQLLPYYRRIHDHCRQMLPAGRPAGARLLRASLPVASLALLFALTPGRARADNTHWLPLSEGDGDGDYLTYAEEILLGTQCAVPIGDPSGPQEAVRFAGLIQALPGTPSQTSCYADSALAFGIETCHVCSGAINMGYVTVHNPLRDLSIDIPFIALHYMKHGSFSYDGSVHSGRVDVGLLKQVLSPLDSDHHGVPTDGDSDGDGLRDEYEPRFDSLIGEVDSNDNGLDDGAEAAEGLVAKLAKAPVVGWGQKIPRDMPYVQYLEMDGVETCDLCGMAINMGSVRIVNPSSRIEMTFPIVGLHYLAHGRFAYRAGPISGEVDAARLKSLFSNFRRRHHDDHIDDDLATALTNHPNPFNESTEIRFHLGGAGSTTIKIYNINGQLVRVLLSEPLEAGDHRLNWNGQDEGSQAVASGIYFCRLEHGGEVLTTKMMLVK